jgi:hypothetical protein
MASILTGVSGEKTDRLITGEPKDQRELIALEGAINPSPLSQTKVLTPAATPQPGMAAFQSDEDFSRALGDIASRPYRQEMKNLHLLSPQMFEFTRQRLDAAPKMPSFSQERPQVRENVPSSIDIPEWKGGPLPKTRAERAKVFGPMATKVAAEERLDELGPHWQNIWRKQINQESGWNPTAVSSAGARGMGQFMPGTWDVMSSEHGIKGDINDPEVNLRASIRYLKDISEKLGTKNPAAILAAYNWGWGRVKEKGLSRLPTETKEYLQTILGPEWMHVVAAYEQERRGRG